MTRALVVMMGIVLSGVSSPKAVFAEGLPDPNRPELITTLPNKVFTPDGFDDNDNSQIIIHGEFSNTCYKTGPVEATVEEKTKEIRITNKAYYYPGCWCLEVVVPWFQVVNVGVLRTGKYKILAANKQGEFVPMAGIGISRSTNPGPDDSIYAPISEANLVGENTPGKKSLVLKGVFKTNCMSFKEQPKVHIQADNVIVVLPVVEVATQGCQPAKIPFETEVDLGTHSGETLIHVRSLNGNSVNKFVDFL